MTQPANKRFVMEDKLATELALKAPLANPTFTGTVSAGAVSAGAVSVSSLSSSGDVTTSSGNVTTSSGTVSASKLRATSTSGSASADAAIITGSQTGAHLGFGVGGIVAMSDASTYTTLNLQPAGGNVTIGASSTFTPPRGYLLVSRTEYVTSPAAFAKADYPWLRAIRVICVGGGAGGAGAALTGASQNSIGQAGSGGAVAETFITDIAGLAASVTLTVGAGGTAGTAGGGGGAGGDTSFGALCVAAGGPTTSAGTAVAVGSFAVGDNPANANNSTGDIIYTGGASGNRHYAYAASVLKPTPGGNAFFPQPLTVPAIVTTTSAGSNPGTGVYGVGGFPGANAQNQAAAVAGGAGAGGMMIVELYA